MKKILLFAMGALMAMPLMAQEEDVTYLIKNAGFDEDLTFQVDGSMKEAISTTTSLSDRSWAYIAADSTVYARPKTTSGQNRPDGRKLEAVNGFKGRIKGWTMETNGEFPKCEWTYFGSVPYDLASQSVPIADDGSTYLEVPERPTDFDGGIGFVYLRAGWTNSAAYKQVVSLPCAVYRLEYWTININPNTSSVAKDLTQITCRKDVFKDEESTGLNSQVWTKHEFEFTPTAEFTMQFGYEAANAGSGGQPIVALDGIKLYKIDEADPVDILTSDLITLQEEYAELSAKAGELDLMGLIDEIDAINGNIDVVLGGDVAEMEATLKKYEAYKAVIQQAIDAVPGILTTIEKMEELAETTDYAGKEAFKEATQALRKMLYESADDPIGTAERILAIPEQAQAAIRAYILSQEAPADFTLLINHPWFIKTEAEPADDGTGYLTFPNSDSYTQGSTNDDLTSEGWYISGAEGGDQRLNWQQNRSCWNCWNNNFTTTIGVAQDITGLPNGYYQVTADMITQSDCENAQYVFAKSTAGKAVSPVLSEAGWSDDGYGYWSTLTSEQVLVVDGKLTIGAEGTGNGSGSRGWFLVTNFKLQYVGAASEEQIAQAYTNMVAEYTEYANAMHLAADKAAFLAVIAENTGAADVVAAMAALSAAKEEAMKSEAKYLDYLPADESIVEGKTLRVVKQTLAENGYAAAQEIMQFAFDQTMGWINGATATYEKMDSVVNMLKNYLNIYVPVYNQAAELAAVSSEAGKNALNAIMAAQKAKLVSEMCDAEAINAMVEDLKSRIKAVEMQNIVDGDATDYTVFIQNPNAEASDGWTFEMGNGDGNGEKSGQWFDGSNTRYFDTYNGAGLTGFKASQVVKGLPNGTYNVGVYTRTPAEGAYVFYAVSADTVYTEIPLTYYQGDETQDTVAVASDKFGPIWEEAKAAVEAGTATEVQANTYNANNSIGRGWKHQDLEGIVVTNHELCIGTLAGNTETRKTEKTFAGAWYSVGGWTLTLVSKGDNTGWEGPLAEGIETVAADGAKTADGIYTLNGVKVAKMQRGLNIVISNGKAIKVMVK